MAERLGQSGGGSGQSGHGQPLLPTPWSWTERPQPVPHQQRTEAHGSWTAAAAWLNPHASCFQPTSKAAALPGGGGGGGSGDHDTAEAADRRRGPDRPAAVAAGAAGAAAGKQRHNLGRRVEYFKVSATPPSDTEPAPTNAFRMQTSDAHTHAQPNPSDWQSATLCQPKRWNRNTGETLVIPAGALKCVQHKRTDFNPDADALPRELHPPGSKYLVIKSYSEANVYTSIKYNAWTSTKQGTEVLDAAFDECAPAGSVFLFFSVTSSGHFVGLAEMKSRVDGLAPTARWGNKKWKGECAVEWRYIKDIPNKEFAHIKVTSNGRRPMHRSHDAQVLTHEEGREAVRVMSTYAASSCLLDDWEYYEAKTSEFQIMRVPVGATSAPASTSAPTTVEPCLLAPAGGSGAAGASGAADTADADPAGAARAAEHGQGWMSSGMDAFAVEIHRDSHWVPDIIVLVGIPGCGKTTFARALDKWGWRRISQDDLGRKQCERAAKEATARPGEVPRRTAAPLAWPPSRPVALQPRRSGCRRCCARPSRTLGTACPRRQRLRGRCLLPQGCASQRHGLTGDFWLLTFVRPPTIPRPALAPGARPLQCGAGRAEAVAVPHAKPTLGAPGRRVLYDARRLVRHPRGTENGPPDHTARVHRGKRHRSWVHEEAGGADDG